MANNKQNIQLTVPGQDLDQLSFCETKPAKVIEWVEQLPLANLGETTKKLYMALPEIGRLKAHPRDRFAMLEALRLCVNNSINGLTHHFLNQPIILPQQQLKIATLAQAIQKHFTAGYKQTIKQFDEVGKLNKQDRKVILPTAIERAMTGSGLILLRCFQLYVPIPPQLWFELHQLYLLADREDLLDILIHNSTNSHRQEMPLRDAYLRTLLMGTIKPNQLRQIDLDQTFQALELWTPLVEISETPKNNLFVVQLTKDTAPIYSTQLKEEPNPTHRHVSTRNLVGHITKAAMSSERSDLVPPVPVGISQSLIEHLITTWSVQRKRSFDRSESKHHLTICVGLRDFHYHIADETPFSFFTLERGKGMVPDAENYFLSQRRGPELTLQDEDVWGNAFDAGKTAMDGDIAYSTDAIESKLLAAEKDKYKESHKTYEVQVINTSPGGFCLEWDKSVPQHVRTGEVIGIQEEGSPNWSVGIMRWVRQVGGQRTQIGIELLSPTAIPYGAARITKKGDDGEYMRALMLPELKLINQAATLITTQMPFQQGHKLKLNQYGCERIVHLTKRILTTSSVSQFEFRILNEGANVAKNDNSQRSEGNKGNDDDFFDSIWNKL